MRRIAGMVCAGLLLSCFSVVEPQRPVQVCPGFLPENNLKIPVSPRSFGGLSEAQYNEVMDRLEDIYGPIVAAKGGVLKINRLWENPTVNSSAQRQGKYYILNMYGGLARHPSITQDGETLVACHEMMHHIGGAPKIEGMWATNEGQSDYAANLKCMRLMFSSSGTRGFTRMAAPDPVAQKACQRIYKDKGQAALCLRVATAGLSVTGLFKAMHEETVDPAFDTPDQAAVEETSDDHPATQCRLDTYFQSALCSQPVSKPLSDGDPAKGTCTRSQGYYVGLRPLCWYKPPQSEGLQLLSRSAEENRTLLKLQGASLWQGL